MERMRRALFLFGAVSLSIAGCGDDPGGGDVDGGRDAGMTPEVDSGGGDVDSGGVDAGDCEGTENLCTGASDEDCDGLVDCDDSDCAADPTCIAACTPTGATETACGDGADDDCDGAVDCGDDDCLIDAACATCVPSGDAE